MTLTGPRDAEAFTDCDAIGVDIAVIAELFTGFSLGRPIPSNDIWIAANAMKHGMALYSFDRHFDQTDGLPRLSA